MEIKFLRYTNGRFWDFLESEDVKIIDVQFVILGPVVPASTIKKGYTFPEDNTALEIYKKIRH